MNAPEKESLWRSLVGPLKKAGFYENVQDYVDKIGIEKAFVDSDCLYCIDEGVPGGINVAGSYILLDPTEAENFAKSAGIKIVTSHDGCGAAAIAYERLGEEEQKKFADSDEFGKDWAKKLAEKIGAEWSHVKSSKMQRPYDMHIALAVYYDGTGKFDPSMTEEMPTGFVISRKHHNLEYSLKETEIAIGIACGDNGFGGFFSQEPLVIVPIGDPNNEEFSLEKMTEELAPVVAELGVNIKIDGFTAPI
jgi:hypothetical protein